MAADGIFLRSVAWLHPRTRVPVVAILMQGAMAILIALSGKYHEILNYVMSVDIIFTLLVMGSIFIFRRRDRETDMLKVYRVPGHPVTTLVLMAVYAGVGISLFYRFPVNGLTGIAIAAAGIPVYYLWHRRQGSRLARTPVLESRAQGTAAG